MKRKFTIAIMIAILLGGIAGLWLWHNRASKNASDSRTTQQSESVGNGDEAVLQYQTNTLNRAPRSAVKQLVERLQEIDTASDPWRTPIAFYGKVVDESNQPVAGVSVSFSCNDLSREGTSKYQTTSDGQGLFSLKGVKGKLLVLRLSKEGYYTSKRDNDSFDFAGDGRGILVLDPTNPIVFHLQNRGHAEPLFVFNRSYRVARDGTPTGIDLTAGNVAGDQHAHLKVECWTDDVGKKPGQKYDWKCRISVPGGGLQLSTNEFSFYAPADGYKPFDEINMPASFEGWWQSDVERKYFVKLGDGKWGRVKFAMIAGGDHFCIIESYLNPSGSRNLEFDQSVQHKPTQFE